jgi:hypothetical protein
MSTPTTTQLASLAGEIAKGSDGLRRRAALCVALACSSRNSVDGALEYLNDIDVPDIRAASRALLTELAGGV